MSRSRDLANLADEATGGLVKADIGLGNVDNTSDANKPISTAQQTEIDKLAYQGEPHIIPNMLYPAIDGKGIDGTTTVSSFGTDVTINGRTLQYYYTNIKGSNPIHKPCGAFFGSQRHKFKSTQLLEQETATHGQDVYSIDGREWARATAPSGKITHYNRYDGQWFRVHQTTDAFFEITGYFSAVNILGSQWNGSVRDLSITVDGSVTNGNFQEMSASVKSPLADHDGQGGRYVDASSVFTVATGLTLGIHTIKIAPQSSSDYADIFGIELIAHDTSNVNEIKIPKQNVVSYGKKFEVGSDDLTNAVHPHYDPFNGFNNGTSLHSQFVDTDTSLGLSHLAPVGGSATWAITTSNQVRPYNGGRVVKWIDSSGNIKTSVNMMPPNAQNISGTTAGTTEVGTPSATNTTPTPIFSDDPIDHSLAEVAKTFHWREFGNGSANGGTTATYADASMLNSNDAIAYVMDDGLSSFSSDAIEINSSHLSAHLYGTDDFAYITFIGTGITVSGDEYFGPRTIAQNLPYGSHILKIVRDSNGKSVYSLDGVSILTSSETSYGEILEITFHQCKKPPIPEDAVVIADYMLMADFVIRGAQGIDKISKGVRYIAPSRDIFYDGGSWTFTLDTSYQSGLMIHGTSTSTTLTRATSFSTNAIKLTFNALARYQSWYTNDTAHSSADTTTKVGANESSFYYPTATTLGNNTYDTFGVTGDGNGPHNHGFEVVTPIHTSSHYQSFETPFLHELVGGDRNMEQTNLVCSPDGRTWDQLTRDTSYLGNVVVNANTDQGGSIFDDWRGTAGADITPLFNKDWAIAYDRLICLKSGMYEINAGTLVSNGHHKVFVNATSGSNYLMQNHDNTGNASVSGTAIYYFQRGDYVYVSGYSSSVNYNSFSIKKV